MTLGGSARGDGPRDEATDADHGREQSAQRAVDRAWMEELATLGAATSYDRALDETITPETFAREASAPREASVGPLPQIALSGTAASSTAVRELAEAADLEILGVLGEGGMGRVHLARQRSLGREVALKMLKDEVASAQSAEMLRVEATIMGRLDHPNVVPVHAVGLDPNGRLVLVMKRIDGAPWRDLLRDADHPRWQELAPRLEDRLDAHLGVLMQVANALELAHERGVVHRDVKPENVLLGRHGEVYLADWGVALRMEGATGRDLVGTPTYMAPEMVEGSRAKIDARTDVFLLGATLHEVLTGSPPYDGPTLQTTLLTAYDCAPQVYDASVPSELAAIAKRAMARDPADRFASPLELRRALEELRKHRGSIAMARTGRALLDALEVDLPRASASDADVDRRLTECRFALVSALREWPGNTEAKTALTSAMRLAIRRELMRANAAGAQSLLSELEDGDAALASEITALEAKNAGRERELARLRSLDADRDLSVGMGPRVVLFAMLALAGVGVSLFAMFTSEHGHASFTPWQIVGFGVLVFGAVIVGIAAAGKRLLANEISRHFAFLVVIATGGLLVHRVIAAMRQVPIDATLSMDLVILAAVGAASGVVVRRGIWSSVPPLLGMVATFVLPDRAPAILSLATLAMLGVVASVAGLELRAKQRASEK